MCEDTYQHRLPRPVVYKACLGSRCFLVYKACLGFFQICSSALFLQVPLGPAKILDDEYTAGGIHCWEKSCRDAEYVTTINAKAKEIRERIAAKRLGPFTGVPMYLRQVIDRAQATSDADKAYLANVDKLTAGFSTVVSVFREQLTAAADVVKAGGELLEPTKDFRSGSAASGKYDSKLDAKKGWKMCLDTKLEDCPFKAFGEKVLEENKDLLRAPGVSSTIRLVTKEIDAKVMSITDPWDRAGAEIDWPGVASRKALELTNLASFGADLSDAVTKMRTVLDRLQALKKNKDREKDNTDNVFKQIEAEETGAKVYGIAKAMCDSLNGLLFGACSANANKDASAFGQRLGQWLGWARLRRPDVNQVMMATDDADPPTLVDKVDKKKGADVVAVL